MSRFRFEWDNAKAKVNLRKHGVSFEEGATVFDDRLAISRYDEEHSAMEDRYITIGFSVKERLLTVGHTDRADRIRIITVRRATPTEVMAYGSQ